jgi:hypothetical protein
MRRVREGRDDRIDQGQRPGPLAGVVVQVPAGDRQTQHTDVGNKGKGGSGARVALSQAAEAKMVQWYMDAADVQPTRRQDKLGGFTAHARSPHVDDLPLA